MHWRDEICRTIDLLELPQRSPPPALCSTLTCARSPRATLLGAMGAPMRLLNLSGWSIKRMLRLEEALLRHEGGNWCLVNALPAGSKTHPTAPTVVVGLSGKPELLLDEAKLRAAPWPGVDVVRRFTGGGTVVVGGGTVVASLVVRKDDAPCEPFPRDIMAWTEGVYAAAFGSVLKPGAAFSLRADDYVLGGDRKVGGNAQCISKDKWIHHTSFLWDYDPAHMAFLALPAKRPEYRGDRDHGAFLSRLRDHVADERDRDANRGAAVLGQGLAAALAPHFDVEAATASKPEGMIEALKAEARRDAGGWKPVDFPPP